MTLNLNNIKSFRCKLIFKKSPMARSSKRKGVELLLIKLKNKLTNKKSASNGQKKSRNYKNKFKETGKCDKIKCRQD